MNAEERALAAVRELAVMLDDYSVYWPFTDRCEAPSGEDDDGFAIVLKHIRAAQREAEERMRKRCAGLAGGHVMSMNGLQIQASIEALPSEYPQEASG